MKCIRSIRGITEAACYDVVYEWEDSIAHKLNLPIKNIGFLYHNTISKLAYINPKYQLRKQIINNNTDLCIILFVKELRHYVNRNIIPIFLDVWGDNDIDFLLSKVNSFSIFFVTSIDVYRKIKEKSPKCNVEYIPLSVSDIWLNTEVPKKKYDVVQIGRRNDILHNFMLTYLENHPDVEYIYSQNGTSLGELEYISSKRGNIGSLRNRNQYMQLLKEAKISLVSSPAIDNSRKDASGIDFPTPRFYESAISYCHMVGRYSNNEEFKALKINTICDYVDTYKEFDKYITGYLSENYFSNKENFDTFIKEHLTSNLAMQIKEIINKRG